MALVSAANSTSQFFAGSTYYGTDWTDVYGPQHVVPFLSGPNGIAQAISDTQYRPGKNRCHGFRLGCGADRHRAGPAMSPSDIQSIGLVILDNNTNRAGGGFWTTYSAFAPLLATSAAPDANRPTRPHRLDVAYEYNINSDAPVDPLNPFALGNSLAAYAYGYGRSRRR